MHKNAVDDEMDLLSTALSGGPLASDALESVRKHFCGVISSLARRYAYDHESSTELVSEGNLALSEALPLYDRTRGVRLGTYIYQRVNSRMQHWIRTQQRALSLLSHDSDRKPRSLDEELDAGDDGVVTLHERVPADQDPPFFTAHVGLIAGFVRNAVARLTERQAEALRLRFWSELSPSEIAERLGVSRPRATMLIQSGLANLRTELAFLN